MKELKMKFVYREKGNKGGIYKILNVENGRIYIGSTSRFRTRWATHKNDLLANRHLNTFLQNDYNKCGPDVFVLEVLEVVEGDKNDRLTVEQAYIDKYYDNQNMCYNLDEKAKSSRTGSRNKLPYDPKTDGRSKPKTEEWRKVTSEKNKEFWNQPEMRKFASERAKKKWANHSANITLIHKETKEEVFIETSLRQFAVDRGLSYKSLNQLVNKKIKSSGGWYVKEHGKPVYISQKGQKRKPLSKDHRAKIGGSKHSETGLVHKDTGQVLNIGPNVKEFAREHGLYYTTLMKVLNGQCKTVNGYMLKK